MTPAKPQPSPPTPDGERNPPTYRVLADRLRGEIEAGTYADGKRLPTEVSLMAEHELSRDTVRRAFRELEVDGLIYRVRGRGTFASSAAPSDAPYMRTVGSLEDMTSWPNTRLEVLQGFEVGEHPDAAERLDIEGDVAMAVVRRHHQDVAFVVTRHFVAPELGARAIEAGIPSDGETTVIGRLEGLIGTPILRAEQTLSAISADDEDAAAIHCKPGDPILRVARVYFDALQKPVEYTLSHFNPERYAYRTELRRRSMPS